MLKNLLDKKAKVKIKIYGVTKRQKIITIYMLPNISRSKGNQTIKFGQIIEYNMKNIFFEKSGSNYGGER